MAESIHFITGRLAESALHNVLQRVEAESPLEYTVEVLPISVAALMSVDWVLRHIHIPEGTTRVVLPGYCSGDLTALVETLGVAAERGPRDLRQLPEFLGREPGVAEALDRFTIEILAEINHAPRLSLSEIVAQAERYVSGGADVIDLGCEPGHTWQGVADAVTALRDRGWRVSIDSFEPREIAPAAKAGAELVLSVNSNNRDAAPDWGCEVVAIPDHPQSLDSLEQTLTVLDRHAVPARLDPILEPIGLGLAASICRYAEVRKRYPDHAMLMGVGNVTELTDVDSAGLNVLLLGICQELRIHSVLTTEVINWARTSVRECDLARRLVQFAVDQGVPPKRLMSELLLLRDRKLQPFGPEQLDQLASQIRDGNIRLFAEDGQLHALGAGGRWSNSDPFALFEQLLDHMPKRLDATHAFYLGFEMCKAALALQLGKEYRQDESLDWGFLTTDERWHRLKRDN